VSTLPRRTQVKTVAKWIGLMAKARFLVVCLVGIDDDKAPGRR
jgi:hypothetical protein